MRSARRLYPPTLALQTLQTLQATARRRDGVLRQRRACARADHQRECECGQSASPVGCV
ncbi:hypothetical protein [Lysobacter sp. A3-1-A15]|uniref:hypothetical protein n=1 Tax=Novilysobacter viscosus TaxID=3098602 RepID=UPI00398329ED